MRVIGAPDILSVPMEDVYRMVESTLAEIQLMVSTFPKIPIFDPADFFSPMETFLQSEVQIFEKLLPMITSEVGLLLRMVHGETVSTPKLEKVVVELFNQSVPSRWMQLVSNASDSGGANATDWLRMLRRRLELLTSYLVKDAPPPVFCIGALNRPDRFLQSALLHAVRQQFKSLNTCSLEAEVRTRFFLVGIICIC